MNIPETFKRSKRAPGLNELDALYDFLNPYHSINFNILEFGAGVTSWAITEALPNYMRYIAVETFEPCVAMVKTHIPDIEIVDSWTRIPIINYGLLFVDGSSGYPTNLKPLAPTPKCPVPFRNDAINYVKDMLDPDCIIVVHDYCNRDKGYQAPFDYLKNNGYKQIWTYEKGYGLGAYLK